MNFSKNILLLLITCLLFPVISYSQDEISEKPKYAPHGEKHKNVSDAKGRTGAGKHIQEKEFYYPRLITRTILKMVLAPSITRQMVF